MSNVYAGLAVVVQARLNSSRLPRKVLMDIGGKPLLEHTLEAMRQIPAERYILACDDNSVKELSPIAAKLRYTVISGSETDVLNRFCAVIKHFESSLRPITSIVRATADNPFLFTEAALASVRRFFELEEPDYFTFTGLPHGSGIEILKARSLLAAEQLTDDPYDHEHVGPALYRHTDTFSCIREPAPEQWYMPQLRTTIDTEQDYERACFIIQYLQKNKINLPPSSSAIVKACKYADKLVVFVPSVQEGQGSGHLRRVCVLMRELSAVLRCALFLPEKDNPPFVDAIIEKTGITALIHEIPQETCLIILDNFRTDIETLLHLKTKAPVVALDEGGAGRAFADYILDVLPSLGQQTADKQEALALAANMENIRFIPFPKNRKKIADMQRYENKGRLFFDLTRIKVLVVCGGEDAAQLALPAAQIMAELGSDVSVINPAANEYTPLKLNLHVFPYINNIRERLYEWDMVITHYGFTAFEALAAGCAVILVSPTEYHRQLGAAAGFSTLPEGKPAKEAIQQVCAQGIAIPSIVTVNSQSQSLSEFIFKLAYASALPCPICGSPSQMSPVGRAADKTICFCPTCRLHYPSFIVAQEKKYGTQYFFEEYQAQYGKTYLEDFDSIKGQGLRRMALINTLYAHVFNHGDTDSLFDGLHNGTKRILDIGCAYGPFLAAAKEEGWSPVGIDVSAHAVAYVRDMLEIPACETPFPLTPDSFQFTLRETFTDQKNQTIRISLQNESFSAVTMWFVIEHFQDLDSVLRKVQALLVHGGIFAFSTPTLSGVTGRWKQQTFFAQSPSDHYTIWDMRQVKQLLAQYGFEVRKMVSIGHHPERFPHAARIKKDSITWKLLMQISKLFKLGDSMEIYAVKQDGF